MLALVVWATCITTASATGQEGERLVWNGKEYEMLTEPLGHHPAFKSLLKRLEEVETRTSLWRGYVGHWEIEDGMLYLDFLATEGVPPLKRINYPEEIPELRKYCKMKKCPATWFSDTLRVVSGNMIFYEHGGWSRYYEHEDFIVVKQGKVVSVKRVENKVLIKGMVNNGRDKEYIEYFKKLGADLHKRYPEARGRIPFQVQYTAFDQNHMPTAVNIKFLREEPSYQQMAHELREKLSQYILTNGLVPLYLINGKPTQIQYWTFSIAIH